MPICFTIRYPLGRPLHYLALFALALAYALLVAPAPTLADAPVTRGEQIAYHGSVGTARTGSNAWQGIQALPLPTRNAHGPVLPRPNRQTQDSGVWSWLGLEPNIGKWVMDAGLGVSGGLAATANQTLLLAIQAAVGDMSSITECESTAAFIFCAPESMFFGDSGFSVAGVITMTWRVLSPIGISLVTIIFIVRLSRLIIEGASSVAEEGKRLVPTFLATILFVAQPAATMRPLFTLANTVSSTLLRSIPQEAIARLLASFQPGVSGLSLASNMISVVLMIITLLVILKAAGRMFRLMALLAVAPLMGALLLDRATAPRFWAWFLRTVDTLLAQIPLVIFFWLGVLFWQPHPEMSAQFGDMTAMILSIFTFGMMLGGESILAGLGLPSTPSSMVGRLVAATAIQRAIPLGRRMPRTGAGAALQQQTAATAGASEMARVRGRGTSGDPAASAAAQRQPSPGASGQAKTAAGAGMFRMLAAGSDDVRDQRAMARIRAAQSMPQWDAQAGQLSDAGRTRAGLRAGMMRRQALRQRENGNAAGADELVRKAAVHERMARTGEVPSRPGRTPDERERRRAAFRQAALEIRGERDGAYAQQLAQLAVERERIAAQHIADQARRGQIPGVIARARAASEARAARYEAQDNHDLAANARAAGQRRIDALDREHIDLSRRIERNQSRLREITRAEQTGRGTNVEARAASARRARERLGETPRANIAEAGRPRPAGDRPPTPFVQRTLHGASGLRAQESAARQQDSAERATQAAKHAQATRQATTLDQQQRAARTAQARRQTRKKERP